MKSKKTQREATYNPRIIEEKWQEKWEKEGVYRPDLDKAKKPFYNLMMFPYPSAEGLHVGSVSTFSGVDTYGRFKRMQGYDVFEPMGLDGFGIHSENYALKVGKHPKEQAHISEKNFYRQLSSIGNGYDWSRKLETYDPVYYRWTQWIFIQLFKAGLAYRKKAPVNFCPSCKTVLADEQVIDGKCERCSSVVEKRELEQWFFKITNYAERLLKNIKGLNWTEKVKIAQREWIGKSEGMIFTAHVKDSSLKIQTFSAHFEAFRADTFVVIAPDHPLLEELLKDSPKKKEVLDFCQKIIQGRKSKGYAGEKQIEGIFTEKYIVDPVGNGDLPIWVASYAVKEYGTGIVKCSAHDERDFVFAKKYGIRLRPVLFPEEPEHRKRVENLEECYNNMKEGYLSEPSEFAGKRAGDIRKEIVKYLVKKELAEAKNQYHLRDWLISRQRYWGPPIPMVYCEACAKEGRSWFTTEEARKEHESRIMNNELREKKNHHSSFPLRSEASIIHHSDDAAGWFPVPEDQLPVLLPDVEDWRPEGSGTSPLANHPEFYKTTCPSCSGEARRETDVSDTFLDSAWYFFRYLSTEFNDKPFDKERANKWLPVTMYIGGAEHSVLHLLYSRFITMVFKDMRLIDFEEPYARFYAHGLIIKDGAKMSKSKGNVINPDEYLKKYGADTLRAYLRFVGPFDKGGDFRDSGIEGMQKFLKKVWKLLSRADYQETMSEEETRTMHKTIRGVTEDMENLRFNTAVAKLMTYYNFLSKKPGVSEHEAETFVKLLAPIAPFLAEELYQRLRPGNSNFQSVHTSAWPVFDKKYLVEDEVTIVVQVNGKVRDTFRIQHTESRIQHTVEDKARESGKVKQYLAGKNIEKVIYIEGKIVNFVTE